MTIPNWLKKATVPFLGSLLILLLAALVSVMFSKCAQEWIGGLLGLSGKNDILKFLGFGVGGILLIIQATLSYKRAQAMEDAAKAQARATEEQAKANENAEKGLRQERLKNAIEHLGHSSDSVRLGGAYELFHLAEDTESLRQTVLDILCAHIRRTTGEAVYQENHHAEPSEEIQSLLTLLFVQEHEVFKGLHINLQGSWLNGADLEKARLEEANLNGVHLQEAVLSEAHLQRANLLVGQMQKTYLQDAQLQRAVLNDAELQSTNLQDAQLHGAYLLGTQLQGACFKDANLRVAHLWRAQLQGAEFQDAQMQGTFLGGAQLQGANLQGTHLQGAHLVGVSLQGVTSCESEDDVEFVERIRGSIGSQSDFSGVIFSGGLSQGDVDSLVEGLTDNAALELREVAKGLREKLAPHIGKPISHELPKDSGAITGAYTAEEAEEWIAEYERAMTESE